MQVNEQESKPQRGAGLRRSTGARALMACGEVYASVRAACRIPVAHRQAPGMNVRVAGKLASVGIGRQLGSGQPLGPDRYRLAY